MATTYKFKTAGVETLTARLYADQIEVYPGHDLEACLKYQWKYDDRINGFVDIVGATSKTYDVDLSTVASSGDYYCEIQVGNTGDCDQVTETRTISIVDCVSPEDVLFDDGEGSGEAIVEAPHYETPMFSTEGADFITVGMLTPCATASLNTCRFVQAYTVEESTDKSAPREAQLSITVGELVCFTNIGQDRVDTAPAEPIQEKGPDGPFINLSNDGPSLALGGGFGTNITVTAEIGVIGGTIGTPTVAWSVSSFDSIDADGNIVTMTPTITPSSDMLSAVITNPGPIVLVEGGLGLGNPITVTAVLTDEDTGLTATETSIADFYTLSALFPDPPSLMGDVYGFVNWLGWSGDPGVRTVSGSFTAGGSGNWDASFTLLEGFIDTTSATLTYSLNGPGISINNETLTISGESEARRNISYTGMSGVYDWEVTISGVQPSTLSRANGSALFTRRFF